MLNFEWPMIDQPIFRVYYANDGRILFYTSEDEPGNFIFVRKEQFAQARMDLKVIGGLLVDPKEALQYAYKESNKGTRTVKDDISIIATSDYNPVTYWSIHDN